MKRDLPKLPPFAMRSGIASEIAPSALDRWQSEIRAAERDDNNVISILGAIGEDFFGEGITARRVSAALRSIGPKDVVVHLNSPGGNFFEGLAIYNLLRDHKHQVTVKVLGIAASAASVVAMAGDEIQVPRAGFLMMHNTWVVAVGDRHDLREFADTMEPFDNAVAEVYAARSGMDPKAVQKLMDKETWLGGQEAIDKGFADELLPADQVAKDAKAASTLGISAAARRIDVMLAKAGVSRAERARLIADVKSGTRDAAEDALADAGVSPAWGALLSEIQIT